MPLKLVAFLLLHCMSEHEGEQASKQAEHEGGGVLLTSFRDTREGISIPTTTTLPQFRTPTGSTRQFGSPRRANG